MGRPVCRGLRLSVSPRNFDAPISTVSLRQCRKFPGYSQDIASKFLSEFQSFATILVALLVKN